MFFLSRFLPLSWSILSFGLAFAGLFTIVGDIGFSTANIRLLSQGEDEGECNSTFLLSKLIFNGAYAVITVVALLIWVVVLQHGFEYSSEFWVVIALIPYYFFFGMRSYTNSYYTAKLKPAKYVLPSIAEVIIRNSIFILLALSSFYHFQGLSQEQTAIVLSGIYSFTYMIYFTFAFMLGRPWKFSAPSMKMFRKYLAIALPLALAGMVGTINQNIDKVIIQFFWGVHATGAFFLDQKIIMVLTGFTTSVAVFVLPLLARIHAGGTRDEMNVSIKEFERIIMLFSLPVATVFGILSLYVVNIFSGFFTDYYYVLSYLSVFAIISLNSYPYWNALIANGHQRSVGIINVAGLSTNIALNVITIPPVLFGVTYLSLGVLGGAVSTLVSSTVMNIAYRIKLHRVSGTKFNPELLRLLIPTAIQAVFLYILIQYVHPFDILILGPVVIAAVLIYTGVAILIRELTVKEIITFVRNINPLKLMSALREE